MICLACLIKFPLALYIDLHSGHLKSLVLDTCTLIFVLPPISLQTLQSINLYSTSSVSSSCDISLVLSSQTPFSIPAQKSHQKTHNPPTPTI